jgi:hypothetical protein
MVSHAGHFEYRATNSSNKAPVIHNNPPDAIRTRAVLRPFAGDRLMILDQSGKKAFVRLCIDRNL